MKKTDDVPADIITAFDLAAAGYDKAALRYFPFCADYLTDWIRLEAGQKLLDIACGTGAVTLAAAQRVGPAGRIQAIDLSEKMIAQAVNNIQKMKFTNVDFHRMDAAELAFKSNYFDAVVCSFGLFFLTDLGKAIQGWLRVLKPGGTVAFTSFTENAFMPQMKLLAQRLIDHGVVIDKNESFERLQSERGCRQLFEQLAVEQITAETRQFGIYLENYEDWWTVVWNSGLRYYLMQLDDVTIARLQAEHFEDIQQLMTDKGIWLDVEVILTKAQKKPQKV